ncbi:hypothetical protein [Mycolicibacterium moriokaense]|nr:hypothetical protein [Mycolicibacterium moriokaense]
MTATTPDRSCPLPAAALDIVRTQSRRDRIDEHWITVNYSAWWDEEIAAAGLPGGPLKVRRRDDGAVGLSRADVFGLARPLTDGGPASDEQVLALLWNTLAWGTRAKRAGRKRIRAVADNPNEALSALRTAIALSSTDPEAAYDTLYPRIQGVRGPRRTRRPAIAEIGPAFFTKVLYFAGAGDPNHPCLILDSQVAGALGRECQWKLSDNYWWPETYQRYIDLLGRWAAEASGRIGRPVARDEFERYLFGR